MNLELWLNELFTTIEFDLSEYIERVCDRYIADSNLNFGEFDARPDEFPTMVCHWIWT